MSTNNNFQSFAFVDSPPPRIQRTADKKAKLVFLSSDDEGDKVVAKATTSTDSSPWIEAIDHNNPAIKRAMEKPIVFQAARTQLMRNTMVMQNPITKRDIGYVHRPLDPLPESSTVDMRAILSAPKKDSILDKLSDDYDPLFEARERANQQKALIREQRVQKREESLSNANANTDATNANNKKRRIFLDSDDEEGAAGVVQVSSSSSAAPRRNKVISLDSDEESPVKRKEHIVPVIKSKPEEKVQKKKDRRIVDSDDEYEDGWNDELTKAQLKSKADDVIKQCERVSKNLRASLKEWEGNKENTTNDCINLTSIQATTSQGVLNDADIDAICPGLVLNNYQLVGVNWLRLLYINNVNGVLAGKFCCFFCS